MTKPSLPTFATTVDFVERTGSTALEAGLAVYLLDPHPRTAKVAAGAAALAALKALYKALVKWQVARGAA